MQANQPAFPTTDWYDQKPIGVTEGLTKRELMAAMIMASLCSNTDAMQTGERIGGGGDGSWDSMAKTAVSATDALIRRLSEKGGEQ